MRGIQNPVRRKKLLSEDRTFQQTLEVAIADEIAAKERVHVQLQIPFPRILQFRRPLAGILVYLLLYAKLFVLIRLRLSSRIRTLLFSCGNAGYVRSKCKFKNTVCAEGELTEEA